MKTIKQVTLASVGTITCFIINQYTFQHYLALLGILLILKRGFLLCIWFILFSYFRLHEVIPQLEPFKIPEVLAISSLIVLIWQIFFNFRQLKWHPLHAFLIYFTLWVMFSCIFTSNRTESLDLLTGNFLKVVAMVFTISLLPTNIIQLKRIPILLYMCGLLVASVALYNKYHGIGLVEITRVTIGREYGSMLGDPNDLSLVLLFPLSFSAVYMFHGQKPFRVLSGLISFTLLAGIYVTESRGGQLGVISVAFTSFIFRTKNIIVPIIISGFVLILLFIGAGVENRLAASAGAGEIDESAMGRLHAWAAAFRMAIDHPFTGVGLGNFYNNYYFYSEFWDGKNHAVHSSWLEILAENGFVGLFLFLILLINAFKLSYRLLSRLKNGEYQPLSEGLWIGLISFSVSGTFLTQGMTWPFYILLSLLIATDHLTRKIESKAPLSKTVRS